MTEQPEVMISPGNQNQLTVRPAPGVALRRVSSDLRRAGLSFIAEPGTGCLVARGDLLDKLITALGDWQVQLAPSLTSAVGSVGGREDAHQAALNACRALSGNSAAARAMLAGYAAFGVLDPHQVIAVAIASHPDVKGLCVFDEQGLGKTVEALFAFDRSRETGLVERAVVLAPKNMVLEWVNDLERFFPGKYRSVAVVGNEIEKRGLLDRKADLYVTNFETAARLGPRLREVLGSLGLLVVDESFFVKNRDSQRTMAVASVRTAAARCLVLCGTPAPNSAVDLVEQFNIADGGVAFAGVEIPVDLAAAREVVADVVARRGVYLRRLKTQVLDLPGRTFNKVQVQLERRQRELYDAALSGLVADVRAVDDETFHKRRATFAGRRMALLQACSNPAALDLSYTGTPAKLTALDHLLGELIDQRGEKVLVWSFFTRSLDAIASRYAKYAPARIDGTVTRVEDRREAVRKFQEDNATMLFIGNPAAAGAGLTLHRARHAVYESMSNQAAHYLQSLDRIHRRGQEREVEYHVLLATDTIEASEYDRLLRKEVAAQQLLGDEVEPPVTRDGFLADLLAPHRASVSGGGPSPDKRSSAWIALRSS